MYYLDNEYTGKINQLYKDLVRIAVNTHRVSQHLYFQIQKSFVRYKSNNHPDSHSKVHNYRLINYQTLFINTSCKLNSVQYICTVNFELWEL